MKKAEKERERFVTKNSYLNGVFEGSIPRFNLRWSCCRQKHKSSLPTSSRRRLATRFLLFGLIFTLDLGCYNSRHQNFGNRENTRKREFYQEATSAVGIAVGKNPRFEFSRQQHPWPVAAVGWDRGVDPVEMRRPMIPNGGTSSTTTSSSSGSSSSTNSSVTVAPVAVEWTSARNVDKVDSLPRVYYF